MRKAREIPTSFPREGRTWSNNRSTRIDSNDSGFLHCKTTSRIECNGENREWKKESIVGRRRGAGSGVPLWKTEMHFSRGKAIFSPRAACLPRVIYNFHCTLAGCLLFTTSRRFVRRIDDSTSPLVAEGIPKLSFDSGKLCRLRLVNLLSSFYFRSDFVKCSDYNY